MVTTKQYNNKKKNKFISINLVIQHWLDVNCRGMILKHATLDSCYGHSVCCPPQQSLPVGKEPGRRNRGLAVCATILAPSKFKANTRATNGSSTLMV